VDPPFHGRKLIEDSGGIKWDQILRIFSRFSVINGFGMPLPTTI